MRDTLAKHSKAECLGPRAAKVWPHPPWAAVARACLQPLQSGRRPGKGDVSGLGATMNTQILPTHTS